jgi:hypothetical protein
MKRRLTQTVIMILVGLATVSCTRHDCEYGDSAKFVYLKEPYTVKNIHNGKKYTIKAHVIIDITNGGWGLYEVFGPIPRAFQTEDTLNVKVSLERVPHVNGWFHFVIPLSPDETWWVYKITCIENE